MLLLPLLLLWARKPMHFSNCLLHCLVPMITVIAVSVPLGELCLNNPVAAADLNGAPSNPVHREGTLLPPTAGKFVLLGRRWAFVPDRSLRELKPQFPANQALSRFDAARVEAEPAADPNPIHDPYAAFASPEKIDSRIAGIDPRNAIMVVENLLLQRVADAVRADENDDTWTITAKFTEFFDENRLILLTAQRAASH
ncbi:hypothetical protein [Novipirellula artificiosorum]|uniref:Uncharacterized protein n=1 Tax=Novipirellula artificiosorum TaxID=2528016 RepID=A0A5C6DUZ1_9BACT|nr:hypothetical protein [Novipirellula artificiosorum]TWU40478.1 hypothetical protein Poly41_13110 [Novipirellula artificiosorum]